jgi:hypothetical protein
MADVKITALTAIGLNPVNPATFPMPMVDLLDNSMAASGSTRKVTVNQILGSGGTATLASATITGAATVGTTLGVTGNTTLSSDLTVRTNKLAVTSTGVGIGIATPAVQFHIQAPGSDSAAVRLQATGGRTFDIFSSAAGYGAANNLVIYDITGSAERFRIDSTGIFTFSNVGGGSGTAMTLNSTGLGIGMSPSAILSALKSSATQATGLILRNDNGADGGSISLDFETSAGASGSEGSLAGRISGRRVGGGTTGALDFFVNNAGTLGTAKMIIDASGNLLVGLTVDTFAPAKGVSMFAGNSSRVAVGHANGTTSGDYYHSFAYNSVVIGSITQSGTTAVLYNTTSDYRLKESVKPLNGGLARVNALKPSIYNWKSDGSTGEGFLAHELAEVVPFAVSGEKDAMNADGTIKSQGIDMSRVVPILVAAIQELTAEVNALKNA